MKRIISYVSLTANEGEAVPIGYWPVRYQLDSSAVVFYV